MDKIPIFKIYSDDSDIQSVADVIRRGTYWANGPEITQFEKDLADYNGVRYAVVFSNGTTALHAVLLANNIQKGDEIIVPSFTFISTANAPLFIGARPVFADIEQKTFGLDPNDVKEKITQNTKAIIPVHYGGCPCQIRELCEIADENNIIVIEDAAESSGAKIGNKLVGTYGEASILSFCQNKIISTGEGGAVITDSKEIYEKLKLIRSHGRFETSDYFSTSKNQDYVQLGYNFRMPTMNAALGISQLKKIDAIIQMRRDIAKEYTKRLSKIPKITPQIVPTEYFSVFQMFPVIIESGLRDPLMQYLSKKGIITKVYFSPVHLTQFYKEVFDCNEGTLPVTEDVSRSILSLPIYPGLTKREIQYITNEIDVFMRSV